MHVDDPIVQVFVIFTAAKAAGELFALLRQPAIVGELLVGVLLGPAVLGWVRVVPETTALAELGIVVLLFAAGLDCEAALPPWCWVRRWSTTLRSWRFCRSSWARRPVRPRWECCSGWPQRSCSSSWWPERDRGWPGVTPSGWRPRRAAGCRSSSR